MAGGRGNTMGASPYQQRGGGYMSPYPMQQYNGYGNQGGAIGMGNQYGMGGMVNPNQTPTFQAPRPQNLNFQNALSQAGYDMGKGGNVSPVKADPAQTEMSAKGRPVEGDRGLLSRYNRNDP